MPIKKKWVSSAIKKPGSLTATAKKSGKKAMTKKGTIKKSWLKKEAKGDSLTAKRARLAMTFNKIRKTK